MPSPRRAGTSVAFAILVPRVLCAAALTLAGCLITDPAEIGDPLNSPPAIRSPADADDDNVALNQIIRLDWDAGGELELPIVVRDENIADELVVQVWIDYAQGATPTTFTGSPRYSDPLPVIPSTGTPDRDEYTIGIPFSFFGEQDGCHRVEVFVTREFKATTTPHREPETDGDMGTATFWVAMDAFGAPIDMSSCP